LSPITEDWVARVNIMFIMLLDPLLYLEHFHWFGFLFFESGEGLFVVTPG
jgi:hypothetical protein